MNRQNLQAGQTITLYTENQSRQFTIGDAAPVDGGSVVCYEATCGNVNGLLKEFYPSGPAGGVQRVGVYLQRAPYPMGAWEQFQAAQQRYLNAIHVVEAVRQKSRDIDTFIPYFEVYYGLDENKCQGSAYLWTPGRKAYTLEQLCSDFRTDTAENSFSKLEQILRCIEELTNCVCILHKAGLILQDIKPTNVGYFTRGDRVREQAISLFDFDSVRDLNDVRSPFVRAGTSGFTEPQINTSCDCQTDIYSIGATLYDCLIGHKYKNADFSKLKQLLKQSVFLSRLTRRSKKQAALLDQLCDILRSCLAFDRSDRYQNCESLAGALSGAIDLCHALRPRTTAQPLEAIQDSLYRGPLYLGPENELHLLVVGFDNVAQLFLDQLLPLAQCLPLKQDDKPHLDVTVLCSESQRRSYLAKRPSLPAFFLVDGLTDKLTDLQDNYGALHFEALPSNRTTAPAKAAWYVQAALQRMQRSHAQGYQILVSLDQDNASLETARSLYKAAVELGCGERTLARYIWKGSRCAAETGLLPVFIRDDMLDHTVHKEIERMAYNAHRLWDGTLEPSADDVDDFKKSYYHNASKANVTALKWKLASMGIDLDSIGPENAAAEFQRQLDGDGDLRLFDRLIWNEHRRWVAEKLCSGWQGLDVSDCPLSGNRLQNEKKHGCIRHSGPNHKLRQLTELYGRAQVWDGCSSSHALDVEIDQLDKLDRFSLELHRRKRNAVEKARRQGRRPWSEYQNRLQRTLAENELVRQLFFEWESCVEELWRYEQGSLALQKKLYNLLRSAVRSAYRGPNAQEPSEEERLLDQWHAALCPVLEYLSYKDYKENDASMTRNIPFILLYDANLTMAVPYVEGYSVDSILANAGAALNGWPRKLSYLHYVRDPKALALLEQSLPPLEKLLISKKLQASVEMVLFHSPALQNAVSRLESSWCGGKEHRLITIRPKPAASLQDVVEQIKEELQDCQRNRPVALEQNQTPLSYLLEGAGLHTQFGGFLFDLRKQRFYGNKKLESIPFTNSISVENMIRIRGGSCNNKSRPNFFSNYNDLWNIYKNDASTWKTLCQCSHPSKDGSAPSAFLYDENGNRVIASFADTDEAWSDQFECAIDAGYSSTASRLIGILYSWDLLKQVEPVYSRERDGRSQEVYSLSAREPYKSKIRSLLDPASEPELWTTGQLSQRTGSSGEHQLLLQDPWIWVNKKASDPVKQLVKQLVKKGYLLPAEGAAAASSCCDGYLCKPPELKQLLLIEGKPLETYVYHKLRASGLFDDVASSYEVQWETDSSDLNVLNEFDILVTKGYQVAAIECKATNALQPEYYFRLKALTEYFGGQHASSILLNFSDKPYRHMRPNEESDRLRGEKLGVHLITNRSAGGSNAFDTIDQQVYSFLDTAE